MRYASAVFAAVVFCLAGVFAVAPAKADTFDFSFGAPSCVNEPTTFACALGAFTTGAAAADPGFELITGLTFNLLQGVAAAGNPFSFTNVAGEDFQPGAAFNPTTDAFISHAGGGTTNNIGTFQLPEVKLFIDGQSFAQLSGGLFFLTNRTSLTSSERCRSSRKPRRRRFRRLQLGRCCCSAS
jgi:hypothetical protein